MKSFKVKCETIKKQVDVENVDDFEIQTKIDSKKIWKKFPHQRNYLDNVEHVRSKNKTSVSKETKREWNG